MHLQVRTAWKVWRTWSNGGGETGLRFDDSNVQKKLATGLVDSEKVSPVPRPHPPRASFASVSFWSIWHSGSSHAVRLVNHGLACNCLIVSRLSLLLSLCMKSLVALNYKRCFECCQAVVVNASRASDVVVASVSLHLWALVILTLMQLPICQTRSNRGNIDCDTTPPCSYLRKKGWCCRMMWC
jgi:hypothetical protein